MTLNTKKVWPWFVRKTIIWVQIWNKNFKKLTNAYHIKLLKSSCYHFFLLEYLNLFSDVHVAARFCDKRNYFTMSENYGLQKINLNIQVKKNEKSWNSKTLYGKHLLDFLKYLYSNLTFSLRVKLLGFSFWKGRSGNHNEAFHLFH